MSRRILKHSLSLLNIDYVSLDKRWNYTNVLSPYYRLYYIDQGLGDITNGKDHWLLEPGYLYLIPGFTLCNLHCASFMSQYFIHFFEDAANSISLFHNHRTIFKTAATAMDIAGVQRLLELNPHRKINRSDNPLVYEKNIFYKEYEALNNQQSPALFIETQGILLQLVARFVALQQGTQDITSGIPAKIVDLLGFINLNLNQAITVKKLAEMTNYHPDYLSRLFMKLTGERPLSYIHTKRIERAQYLLVTSQLSLAEIAEATGFDNLPHFSRVFKNKTSLPPARYREQHFLS